MSEPSGQAGLPKQWKLPHHFLKIQGIPWQMLGNCHTHDLFSVITF